MNFLLTNVASSSESPEALQHHCSTLASLSSKLTVLNMRCRRSQRTHACRAVCHGTSLPSCLRQGSNMSYGWGERSHRSRRECSDFSSSHASAAAVPDMTFLKLKAPPGLSAQRRCSCLMLVVFCVLGGGGSRRCCVSCCCCSKLAEGSAAAQSGVNPCFDFLIFFVSRLERHQSSSSWWLSSQAGS